MVELMVVAIIVAILAAVAIPLMSANKKRAIATEAQAGCGTIRTALRVYYAENNAYPTNMVGITGFVLTDLNGTYFDDTCYALVSNGSSTYTITCTGNNATVAPQRSKAAGIVVTLDQDGNFTYTGL